MKKNTITNQSQEETSIRKPWNRKKLKNTFLQAYDRGSLSWFSNSHNGREGVQNHAYSLVLTTSMQILTVICSQLNIQAFKAARPFLPAKINDIKPDSSTVDTLKAFQFLDHQILANLKSELPTYLSLAVDLSDTVDPLQWWERNSEKLPCWASTCKKILFCQPNHQHVLRIFPSNNNNQLWRIM